MKICECFGAFRKEDEIGVKNPAASRQGYLKASSNVTVLRFLLIN